MIKTATVTSLGFNITAKWDGTGLRAAQAQLDTLKKSLSSIDGTNLRIAVSVDDTAARSKLESLRSLISNQSVSISVNADTAVAAAKLTALTAQLDHIASMNVTATASVNANPGNLDAIQARLVQFGTMHETASASVNAQAGNLDAIRTRLNQFGTVHSTATADVNAQSGALDALNARLAAFAATRATASASVNTDTASLEEARLRLVAFGAMHVTAHVDVDTEHAHTGLTTLTHDSGSLLSAFGGLASGAGGAGSALGGVGSAGGSASSGVSQAGSSASSSSGSMSALGTAALATTVVLMAMGPAAALTSAIVIGSLGTAFVGLGALALSQTAVVKGAFASLKTSVMADALQAAQGMKGPLLAGIGELQSGLHALVPAFSQAFTAAGSAIKPLVQAFLQFSGNVMPGVITALRAAGPVFEGLRVGMAALGSGMSQMFAGMAAGAAGAGRAFGTFFSYVGQILGSIGVAFGRMADAGSRALGGLMSGLLSLVNGAMAGFVRAVKIMDGALGPFLAVLGKLAGQILQGLLPAVASLATALMMGLTPIMKAIGPLFISFGAGIARLGIAFGPLLAAIGQLVAQFLTALMPAFNALIAVWTKAVATIIVALIPVFIRLIPSVVQLATAFGRIVIAMLPLIGISVLMDTAMIKLALLILPLVTLVIQFAAVLMNAFAVAIRFTIGLFTNWGSTWHTITSGFVIAWNAVAAALTTAWNATWNGMSIAARAIWTGLTIAWNAFSSAMQVAMTALRNAMVAAWDLLWNTFKIVAQAVWVALQAAWNVFSAAMQLAMTALRNAMVAAWNLLWNTFRTVAIAVWDAIRAAFIIFRDAIEAAMTVFRNAMVAAWDLLWNTFKNLANAAWTIIRAGFIIFRDAIEAALTAFRNAMVAAWDLLWNTFKNLAGAAWSIIRAGFIIFRDAIEAAMTAFRNAMTAAWNLLWNTLKTVAGAAWNALRAGFIVFRDAMVAATHVLMNAMSAAWHAGAVAIGAAWDLIKKLVSAPVKAVVDFVFNNGVVKLWNAVAGTFGAPTLKAFSFKGFADGGPVTGPGTATSDSIAARLSAGEHVWTAAEVNAAGGHGAVMKMRADAMGGGYKPAAHGDGIGGYAGGGWWNPLNWVEKAIKVGSNLTSSVLGKIKHLALGTIAKVVSPLLQGIATKVKGTVRGIIPGSPGIEQLIAGSGKDNKGGNGADAAVNPQGALSKTDHGGGMIQKIIDTMVSWIKDHDIPVGGANVASAQKWADAQVGKPYSLGSFGSSFDCSSFMSGIAQVILGKKPSPLFTTFAFTGAKKGPATFERNLNAPFQVGVENRGVGHMAGTINGKNYEATPPKVRSGPGARGAHDKMFSMTYGMKASVGGGGGTIPTGQRKAIIDAALKANGISPSAYWESGMNALINRESSWNSGAINKTDSNAKAGHPSQGLAQTIPSTFNAYHVAGTANNILDPVANVAAAINYIVHRYGGHIPNGPYANGTTNATPGVHLVGENGPEMVMFGGGETVKTAEDTSAMLSGGSKPDPSFSASGSSSNGLDLPAQKLASNVEAWKNYMTQIRTTSDNTWKGVSQTASANWTSMQSSVVPFAGGLAKTISDSGANIVANAKATWTTTRNLAVGAWTDEKALSTTFNAGLQKSFSDTGTAIQTKWKSDWTTGKTLLDKTQADEKAASLVFSTDLQKTYSDTSTGMSTTWKTGLTTSSDDSTKFWTDTKTAYTEGSAWLQSGFMDPVKNIMTVEMPAAFSTSVAAIGAGWNSIKTTVRDPVAAVVDIVFNKGIVAMWNTVATTFGAKPLTAFPMPAYATGGEVNGPGTGTSDSIIARLSAGEHVWTAAETAAAGGHNAVAGMRAQALGSRVRVMGNNGRYAVGGGVPGATAPAPITPTGDMSTVQAQLKDAQLGQIAAIINPVINAAAAAGRAAVDGMLPSGAGMRLTGDGMSTNMAKTVTDWITANDVAPTFGGGSDTAAQAWADAQVGKPYSLGGNFGSTFDCSQYMSGIAKVILGQDPSPWFTTFAFSGDTAPTGFKQGLKAPFMIGITNAGVGHTAGTLNGKNYEATPPAVRSGPSARGYNDPMFTNQYGFEPSIQAAVGTVSDSNHLAIIDAAMKAAGVPPPDSQGAWESGMNTIIIRESSWNSNAINLTDSNATAGMPSQGLAQVIPPTFATYHVAGTSSNILDPVANVAAAINYIVHTYGSIGNVQQANPNLPPKGYGNGTRGAQRGWHRVGEKGEEWVNFRGGEEVKPYGDLPSLHGGGGGSGAISVENHFHGPVTKEALQYAEGEFSESLRHALKAGVGRKGR